ncbi:hypothetical protein BAUCODRAFT_38882 [Baudoinia panamericana UAMH 10762]|uniref:Uncharacterized protein n=1 Tax=Baudoinia panamericana (strain UAMH 10762) TaxID=717646 RepID=M2M553_BAUPA|nr:uncharacterized protein BAUCODRAFT_38882 [Baudoinia panamericana UAMH 10762]EMC91746.1 hypothetical protein BAUCODRAFT_38882 [Baudoinia panamericana UAMH 10762]
MALLKRLSDGVWSFLSPKKTGETRKASANTEPRHRNGNRRLSGYDTVRQCRSMTPSNRVSTRRTGSAGLNRKQTHTPGAGAGSRQNVPKMDRYAHDTPMEDDLNAVGYNERAPSHDYRDGDDQYGREDAGEDVDVDEDEDEDMDDLSSSLDNIHVLSKSPSSSRKGYVEDDVDLVNDTTIVISEEEYVQENARRRKLINLPGEQSSRGVSTEELRAAGWDDDHIYLVQRIAMRGFEPLLPLYWQWDYRYMPDLLFAAEDEDAPINSARASHRRAIKALNHLIELGGRMRDCIAIGGPLTPDLQAHRIIKAYLDWADQDANLDPRTSIPLIALETRPADTPAELLTAAIRLRMARLHARYSRAFRVERSIELTPASTTSNSAVTFAYPIPQIYGIISSHTLIAIVAYRSDTTTPEMEDANEVRTVAYFDMKDKDYDVWNALAIAILVCHARDVRLRVAEETGRGVQEASWRREGEQEEDVDL